MITINRKTKIIAVLTFAVMTIGVIFGGYNMYNANADIAGTTYLKYTYATGQTTEYTLPSIPEVALTNYSAMALSDDDPREDASLDSTLVRVIAGGYTCTGFIIGDHEIMTAGHAVNLDGKFLTPMCIRIPDENASSNSYIEVTAIAAHMPKLHLTTSGYDYAIITVEEDLSQYGKALLGMPTDSAINNHMNIHCLGYTDAGVLKISHGTINSKAEDHRGIICDVIARGGTSGGPLYIETDYGNADGTNMQTYKTVIGVISSASGIIASGPMISPRVLQFAYNNSNL